MSTVIYLANQKIQIVEGTATKSGANLKNCISVQAPEGSIINGIIMDAEAFREFLITTFEENHLPKNDVILVVNSTKFIGRRLELPQMKPIQEYEYISRDYIESGRGGDNMLYGYIELEDKKSKLKKIYAEGIEEDFIREYLDIYDSAGIKIKSIYSGESCLINYSKRLCAVGADTFLMLVIDGTSLIEILFVNGVFYYYNSVRCFQEPGTFEYGQDIARFVSQIIQFMKSEQIESQLDKIVIAGASEQDVENYREAMTYSGIEPNLEVFDISAGNNYYEDIHEFLPAISGLGSPSKKSDFYISIVQKNKRRKYSPAVVKAVSIIATIFTVMLTGFIIVFVIKLIKQAELNKLTDYNHDPVVMMDVIEYDTYAERNEFLKKEFKAIDELKTNIETYPCGNTKIKNVIDGCAQGYARVTYNSFDSKSGVISITATAPLVDDINKFIKNLTEKSEFHKVDYTGYEYDDSSDMWLINVNCIIAEGAGR